MTIQPAYIRGMSALSPQNTLQQNRLPAEIITTANNRLKSIDPLWTGYLDPVMARRMGRVIKMGIVSSTEALNDAGVEIPDAIITGTALGCLGDTEKFLTSVIRDDEQFLTPTHFIQSLQNTVSAQIALQLKCMNHNFTFVHKGFSFESAMLDAMMLLQEKEADTVLTGGIDEMTDHNFFIYDRLNIWKKEPINSTDLLNHPTRGTIAGEGATFFVLSQNRSHNDHAAVSEIQLLFDPENPQEVTDAIIQLLNRHQLKPGDLSLVLWGLNGDQKNDLFLNGIKNSLPETIPSSYFKHLCGEYQTSGAFAMWMAASMIKSGAVPDYVFVHDPLPVVPKNILICNNYENNFALYLIRSCDLIR